MEDCVSYIARSISLPSSGLTHPLVATVKLHLLRLRQASQSEPSSSSIHRSLASINDLYESINSLMLLPLHQQLLSNNKSHRDGVESILEGSLALLDTCSSTTDALSHMKDSILELESSLRRRSGEVCVSSCVSAYKATRRRVIKAASKCVGELRKSEHKARLEKDGERGLAMLGVLKEAQVLCVSTLKSLLVFLSSPKAQHTFPLVAKLMHSEQSKANELAKMDRALFALDAKSLSADVETTQCVQRQLGALERTIDEFGDGLGLVSRCLVRTRVALLNVLNH